MSYATRISRKATRNAEPQRYARRDPERNTRAWIKIPDHQKLFEFVVRSHRREIVISNLNHKEKPKRNTRREFSCRCVARVQVRDSKKRRRYATRADRLLLRQSVRGIESMTPSASLILLTLRFDRQVTASTANADPKHFRYQKPFF